MNDECDFYHDSEADMREEAKAKGARRHLEDHNSDTEPIDHFLRMYHRQGPRNEDLDDEPFLSDAEDYDVKTSNGNDSDDDKEEEFHGRSPTETEQYPIRWKYHKKEKYMRGAKLFCKDICIKGLSLESTQLLLKNYNLPGRN